MVRISNVTWTHEKFSRLAVLSSLLSKKMKEEFKLKVAVDLEEGSIVFKEVEPNRLMLSTISNKIPLKEKDARVKKLGRNYLETSKPTEKQYVGFFSTINKYLDELGLSADVSVTTRQAVRHVIREGKVQINNLPKVNSFPLEK